VPVYARDYGPKNFLWFSDIALFGSCVAMWVESPLLAGMMALAVLLPEIAWNLDFFAHLLIGRRVLGLSDYMFDAQKPRYLRALSLFHVFLPALLVWMVYRLGYDPRALFAQTAVSLIVLPLTYLLTKPSQNINWVWGLAGPQKVMPPLVFLVLLTILFPVVIYLPTHLVLLRLFRRAL
jgi:hypothetical protein